MLSYIGFRVEFADYLLQCKTHSLMKKYNCDDYCIGDIYKNGKIKSENKNGLILARGLDDPNNKKLKKTSNLSLLIPIGQKEIVRVIKIINVLGNGKLLKERLDVFAENKSVLNHLPEINTMVAAINNLEKHLPGIIRHAWYYAPDAILITDE